jgi:hypothetical protein
MEGRGERARKGNKKRATPDNGRKMEMNCPRAKEVPAKATMSNASEKSMR